MTRKVVATARKAWASAPSRDGSNQKRGGDDAFSASDFAKSVESSGNRVATNAKSRSGAAFRGTRGAQCAAPHQAGVGAVRSVDGVLLKRPDSSRRSASSP